MTDLEDRLRADLSRLAEMIAQHRDEEVRTTEARRARPRHQRRVVAAVVAASLVVGGAAAGVPGALVATPLMGAAKALYLDRRGMLPPPKEAALTRRIRQRVEKAKARVEAITDAVLPGDN